MQDGGLATLRRDAVRLFAAGVSAVDGRMTVAAQLARLVPATGPVHAAAVGKAATAMLAGAADALGARLRAGLAICADDYLTDALAGEPRCEIVLSAHPVPDARSVAAATRLEQFLARNRGGSFPLLLLSGGASSMIEAPRPGVTLDDIARANRWLLASGLPIAAVNRVRAALSRIKGGGLAPLMSGGAVVAISDVPGDEPAAIGSGPVHAARGDVPCELPGWLAQLTDSAPPARPPPSIPVHVVASAHDAVIAVARAARRLGYTVRHVRRDLYGDVPDHARELAAEEGAGCCIHAGEPRVRLPDGPGRGGRCTHLAVATALARSRSAWVFLAGATDGRDGNSQGGGALVDAGTVSRARARGYDVVRALAAADTAPLLEATGDMLRHGPTGTNVADVIILLQQRH